MRTPVIDHERGMAMVLVGPAALFGKPYLWVRECPVADMLTGKRPEDQPLTLHRVER